ncbi:winged helix-turn-helix transcriptional regulator [Kribbella sandramycini]|uniref:DNA-binding MarR family transcriptional regulator n=1 Tax=Kribbella sandramycini TaxID=60450 RepID=A0A7Y4L1U2_9ACTN|nr:MarR family winged helix-turn-helix transcriptional regulator [Kribbella sandramycini]MBB6566588.1 DNA-binding MarR family transcriptional regulator [Kribbella sandramycini]NOL42757.1 winged helix-turn-helix transcriptional regulator [Kribbella sandramycini]
MSRNEVMGESIPVWLTADQQRAWLAYMRVQLRLNYEINRQLQTDSGLSLTDYDVLTALSTADDSRKSVTALANQIGWERSRVSHHIRRMERRELLTHGPSAQDRRVTEVTLTEAGWATLRAAAVGHVDHVRSLFFDGLPAELLAPLTEALENIYEHVLTHGTLPRPD